jgi:hypothetical protein
VNALCDLYGRGRGRGGNDERGEKGW